MSNELTQQQKNNAVTTIETENEAHALSEKETREILTPFAFEIDKTLYGTQLALPSKRGIAILIDFFLIAILSGAPGELLAIVFAITLYRLGSNKRAEEMGKTKGRKRRKLMRFIAAFAMFIVLSSVLPATIEWGDNLVNGHSNQPQSNELSATNIGDTVKFTVAMTNAIAKLSTDDCEIISCWQDGLLPSVKILNDVDLSIDDKQKLVNELVGETNLNQAQKNELKERFYQELSATDENTVDSQLAASNESIEVVTPDVANEVKKPVYSVMELVKGIIDDLGLGFGWAAFYFTVFTSLWKGQTPGKKLMGIQVVQLDGTPLSMWDSFGRYGGYGAGIATGLLGFMQIFWDANRQAIHDKISATVVIEK